MDTVKLDGLRPVHAVIRVPNPHPPAVFAGHEGLALVRSIDVERIGQVDHQVGCSHRQNLLARVRGRAVQIVEVVDIGVEGSGWDKAKICHTINKLIFILILKAGVSRCEGVLATCRSERSEESPKNLSLEAQILGDSSLPMVVQNDIVIWMLETSLKTTSRANSRGLIIINVHP